jgi:hypothetical protein
MVAKKEHDNTMVEAKRDHDRKVSEAKIEDGDTERVRQGEPHKLLHWNR